MASGLRHGAIFLYTIYVTLCFMTSPAGGTTDMFTALTKMKQMVGAEQLVAQELKQYVKSSRQRIDELERIALDLESHSNDALNDPEQHLSNPINAYLLIKRFTIEWRRIVDKYFSSGIERDFLLSLYNKTTGFPDQDDLVGSAMALLRLQDTYDLPTKNLAAGALPGVTMTSMNADDCFQLGVLAYNVEDWYHAILWLSQALELDNREADNTANRATILDYLSFATYKRGNLQHAYNLTVEWLNLDTGHERAKNNLRHYTRLLEERNAASTENQNQKDVVYNDRIKDSYRSTMDFDVYERLCRGEKTHDIDERKLTCQFRRHHPMFYLNPLREEVLYLDPRIVVYHQVMSDEEIEKMKALATPRLHRSGVFTFNSNDKSHTDYRTSQSGWIGDEEDALVARLSQRAEAFTNMTLDTVEMFQVLNYGIAGHYEPHYDFARPNEIGTFEPWRGNRILTTIFYMSDVEAGGRTVFNALGVGVPPEKGSALVWYNLLKNGEGDYRTRHAGCPVLSGNKWVVNKWFHAIGQEFTRPCSLSETE